MFLNISARRAAFSHDSTDILIKSVKQSRPQNPAVNHRKTAAHNPFSSAATGNVQEPPREKEVTAMQ
jgi:hypothetical protein